METKTVIDYLANWLAEDQKRITIGFTLELFFFVLLGISIANFSFTGIIMYAVLGLVLAFSVGEALKKQGAEKFIKENVERTLNG